MIFEDAVAALVKIRRKWKNNGSSAEFNKEEGKLFSVYRLSTPDEENKWPEVREAAFKQTENI